MNGLIVEMDSFIHWLRNPGMPLSGVGVLIPSDLVYAWAWNQPKTSQNANEQMNMFAMSMVSVELNTPES